MARVDITIPDRPLRPGWTAEQRTTGVTLVLDAGGISGLAGQRARLTALRERGLWPAEVPAPVLTEALTGDARRDHHVNRLLRAPAPTSGACRGSR